MTTPSPFLFMCDNLKNIASHLQNCNNQKDFDYYMKCFIEQLNGISITAQNMQHGIITPIAIYGVVPYNYEPLNLDQPHKISLSEHIASSSSSSSSSPSFSLLSYIKKKVKNSYRKRRSRISRSEINKEFDENILTKYFENSEINIYWSDFNDYVSKTREILDISKMICVNHIISLCKNIVFSIVNSNELKKRGYLVWLYYFINERVFYTKLYKIWYNHDLNKKYEDYKKISDEFKILRTVISIMADKEKNN